MSGIDLERELSAAITSMNERHIDELIAAGGHRNDIALGPVGGVCSCDEGEMFEPHSTGKFAAVTLVRTHYVLTFETTTPGCAGYQKSLLSLLEAGWSKGGWLAVPAPELHRHERSYCYVKWSRSSPANASKFLHRGADTLGHAHPALLKNGQAAAPLLDYSEQQQHQEVTSARIER